MKNAEVAIKISKRERERDQCHNRYAQYLETINTKGHEDKEALL